MIAASYGEGFGLPLIEAAKHNLPIIARDIPVFREVAGNCATFFKGTSGKQLSKSISEWIEMYKNNIHSSSKSIKWITWEESSIMLRNEIEINQIK